MKKMITYLLVLIIIFSQGQSVIAKTKISTKTEYDGTYVNNIFENSKVKNGETCYFSNGRMITNEKLSRTDYISVRKGMKIFTNLKEIIVYFDRNKNFKGSNYDGKTFGDAWLAGEYLGEKGYYLTVPYSGYIIVNIPTKYITSHPVYICDDINDSNNGKLITSNQLSGKNIVCFGDSIIGNFQDETSIPSIISKITGATVYNVGFGGCKMTQRLSEPDWNPFSMCNLATAIANNDFTLQETKVKSNFKGMPSYFPDTVSLLKSIDFSKVDIVTISYGVNDYMKGNQVENPDNLKDLDYFNGALRNSVELLKKAYPKLEIIVFTPIYAVWFDANGNVIYDSDSKYYNNTSNMTLKDFRDGVLKVCKEYKYKSVNLYDNLGINKSNILSYYDVTDGIHPNINGRLKEAKLMSNAILDLYSK